MPSDPGTESTTASDIRQALLSGDAATDIEIGQIIDPEYEGEAFEWFPAEPLESYASYVARLRTAGWLGTATVSDLSALEGDPVYGVGGVPCSSAEAGATIGTGTPVTFYRNPANSFSDEHGAVGGSCGDGPPAPVEDDCAFDRDVSYEHHSWEATKAIYGSSVLDAECDEAWAILEEAGVLDENGNLTPEAIAAATAMPLRILDPWLWLQLPQHGGPVELWRKVFLAAFGGITFETDASHSFELHFYRDFDGNIFVDEDFKIKFHEWFH